MKKLAEAYGRALYTLAREEGLRDQIDAQLELLERCFAREPDFLNLLADPGLPAQERCRIISTCFRETLHVYLLNLLKLMVQKGHIRCFPGCADTCRAMYREDSNCLQVTAVTAAALTDKQRHSLVRKLRQITGRPVELIVQLEPKVLGGIRLEYAGRRIDGTLAARINAMKQTLINAPP